MIASWRVLWYFTQTRSKPGGTRVSVHTSTVAGCPSQTVPLHSSKVGTGVLEKCFCEEERKTRDKEENEKGKERERSKALWVRRRENFERKSGRLWFELCDGSTRPKVTAGEHLSQILNHKNDYFMANFVTLHSNLWIFNSQSPFFLHFHEKLKKWKLSNKKSQSWVWHDLVWSSNAFFFYSLSRATRSCWPRWCKQLPT